MWQRQEIQKVLPFTIAREAGLSPRTSVFSRPQTLCNQTPHNSRLQRTARAYSIKARGHYLLMIPVEEPDISEQSIPSWYHLKSLQTGKVHISGRLIHLCKTTPTLLVIPRRHETRLILIRRRTVTYKLVLTPQNRGQVNLTVYPEFFYSCRHATISDAAILHSCAITK